MSLPPSQLDANQVLPGAFDDATSSLRTTLASGTTIVISDLDDSIKIGNGSGTYAGVTPAGGLKTSELPGVQFQTSQYTVGTSAVQLTSTPLTGRKSVSIKAKCTSTNIIYVGNSSGVTTANGYALNNGDAINIDLDGSNTVYAISNAAAQTLYVLELA